MITKIWTSIKSFAKSNMFLLIMLTIGIALLFWSFGCESRTQSILKGTNLEGASLLNPKGTVNRQELTAELAYLTQIAETRFADLDRQDKLRELLASQAVVIATGGAVNPAGVISLLMGIMGIGAVIDNRKKQSLITNQALELASLQKSIAINS